MLRLLTVAPTSVWISLAVTCVLVFAIWRHRTGRSSEIGAFVISFIVLVPSVLIAVMTLATVIPATMAVRQYTGRDDVYVKCDSWIGEIFNPYTEGSVTWDTKTGVGHIAELSSKTCAQLRSFIIFGNDNTDLGAVVGVHVLAHEAEHLNGVTDEAQAECVSLQRTGQMAELLGGVKTATDKFPGIYLEQIYPRMPDGYQTTRCAPGEPWDITPGDGVWP